MGSTERAWSCVLSLGGLGVLVATAVYGGKLVFEHAAGIPTEVLQAEMHERAEGHHHHGGEGERRARHRRGRGAGHAAPIRRRGGPPRSTADSGRAGRAHPCARHAAAQGLTRCAGVGRSSWGSSRRSRGASRPPPGRRFLPLPEAAITEMRLPARRGHAPAGRGVPGGLDARPAGRAAGRLARDAWFDRAERPAHRAAAASGSTSSGSAPGPTRRIRAAASSTVETVYRPLADPSLPERELDRQVPRDHPVAIKVRAALQDLVKRYGGPPRRWPRRPEPEDRGRRRRRRVTSRRTERR